MASGDDGGSAEFDPSFTFPVPDGTGAVVYPDGTVVDPNIGLNDAGAAAGTATANVVTSVENFLGTAGTVLSWVPYVLLALAGLYVLALVKDATR